MSYPPDPSPLVTFPLASLTHHVGLSAFPLSTGPCSLVQLENDVLALSINSTTVVLGKENKVRKTDPNEQHASYSFNFSPTPSAASASSSSATELPTTAANTGGYLKLTLPQSKNTEEYDNTTLLARQFEGELQSHALLDTRTPAEIAEEAGESITSVLSGFYRSSVSGIAQTAGSVYSGARELAAEVGKEKEQKGWWGAIKERAGSIGGTPLSSYREASKGKEREEFLDVSLGESSKSKAAELTAQDLAGAGKPAPASSEEAV